MFKNFKTFVIIRYALILFYGSLMIFYGGLSAPAAFRSHSIILSILFAVLLCASCAVVAYKEWGRRLLIGINLIMVFYFMVLWFRFPTHVHIGYSLMCIIVALFFNQDNVKFQINRDWQNIRKSILVVDDDDGFQRTVKRILLPSGYSVLTATTGERGLQIAKTQKPDLIILDVILPGIKGRELCRLLKEDPEIKDIPVIFLTAKDSPDDIDAEMAAGAVSHLTKPVDAKILLEEIKNNLS